MTTIAYRAGVLAADTQVTSVDGTKLRACKIETIGDMRAAFAGDSALIDRIRAWMHKGMPARGKPRLRDSDDFDAIVVKADGTPWMLNASLEFEAISMPFLAIGSGADYAMGAMACGRGAVHAVKVAARFDVNTSGPVNAFMSKVVAIDRPAT